MTSRQDFEAWIGPHYLDRKSAPGSDTSEYEDSHINMAWKAWQAARRAPSADLKQATELATWLWNRHYRQSAPQWEPAETLSGVLSQIDNMVCTLAAPSTPAVAEGMPASQEPKYGIRDNRLYNRASGEFIPEDEPVFIFRARDVHAFSILAHYGNEVCNPAHASAILARVNDFKRFWNNNPDRMKEPDTDASPAGSAQAGKSVYGLEALSDDDIWHIATQVSVMAGGSLFDMSQHECVTELRASFMNPDEGREFVKAAADGAGEMPPLDDSFLDYHLNLILIASDSALRHYSMHKTKEDMRIALRETIKAAWGMK